MAGLPCRYRPGERNNVLRVLPTLLVAGLALYSFFDVLSTQRERFRGFGKVPWLFVTLIPIIGAVLWFILGRPRRGDDGSVISLGHAAPRQVAPDDDPAFLRQLDEQAWRAKREQRAAEDAKDKDPEGPSGQDEAPLPAPGDAGGSRSPEATGADSPREDATTSDEPDAGPDPSADAGNDVNSSPVREDDAAADPPASEEPERRPE